MKKKTVRAGIVGARFSASFHFEAVRRVYGTDPEVIGVHAATAESRERYAAARGIKAYDNLDSLLDEVDIVHVCAPPVFHEPIAIAALEKGVNAIVEKPFTGYFDRSAGEDFDGRKLSKEVALDGAMKSVANMLEAEAKSDARMFYAENWVYAPAVQKEREIIEKTGAQILWMHGEEAHSGSHSQAYGYWRLAGGGAMIGKGCHPLTAALYLKRVEGRASNGTPIRPATITSRTHELTRLPAYRDAGFLRTDYHDIEDFAMMHVTFEDGTIATLFSSEIVMGGIHNWIEIVANNHRGICNINPNTAMQTYNPAEKQFEDIYVVEKIETKQGWASTAPDEDFVTGFPQEIEAFYHAAAHGGPVEGDSGLGADTIATIYAGYLSAERGGAEVKVPRL